jgi:hypothetical protein
MALLAQIFGGGPVPDMAEVRRMSGYPDTSIADYVWLPLRFDGEMAYLDWKDEWRVEDYA